MRWALVIGIIFLFVGIAIFPGITAVDKDIDINNEKIDNSKIGAFDNYTEIISFINIVTYPLDVKIEGSGIYRYLEMWADLIFHELLVIKGFRYSHSLLGVSYYEIEVSHVIAPRFIGFYLTQTTTATGCYGIALGNIEWE